MLNKEKLKTDIISILNDMKDSTDTQENSFNIFAERLSDCIDSYVKTATIVSQPSQVASAGMNAGGVPVVSVAPLVSNIS